MRLWELFNDRVVSLSEAQKPVEKLPLIQKAAKPITVESVDAMLKRARTKLI